MGFDAYHNRKTSPARIYRKWAGGEGKLVHWDGENNIEENLPFEFCILEQTRRITGFAPMGSDSIRYFSNETVGYDDEIVVKRKKQSSGATEIILRGKYADIKEKLPQGARLAINLYIYNKAKDQIEVMTLQGASLGAFIEFSKKNKIYESSVVMSKGEEKVNGTVHFFPPEFKSGSLYDDDLMKVLVEADKQVVDYQKAIRGEGGEGPDKIDQTPSTYEGEMSQEVNVVEDENIPETTPVSFDEIPF